MLLPSLSKFKKGDWMIPRLFNAAVTNAGLTEMRK